MRLIKLEVKNWRGLQHKTIEFAEGITVIGGPNECGKTSLRQALRDALLSPRAGAQNKKHLEAKRPWKTSLYPTVSLEIETNGRQIVVVKEFLCKKNWATLHVDGRLVAQDEEVQNRLLEQLDASAEWIDVLWGEQGEAKVDVPPESVKGRLAAAARDTVMPQVADLERLIKEEYGQWWTPKKGEAKDTLIQVRSATMAAEESVREKNGLIEAADKQIADLEERKKERDEAVQAHRVLAEQLKAGQASLGQWETFLRVELESDNGQKRAKECEEWVRKWDEALVRLPGISKTSDEWQQLVDSMKSEMDQPPKRSLIEALTAKQHFLRLSLAAGRYAAANQTMVPSSEELTSLKEQRRALTAIDARLSAGAMKAKLLAEKALEVFLSIDGKGKEALSLAFGKEHEWSAEDKFEVQVPGVMRLEVESGSAEVKTDVIRRKDIADSLGKALQKWQASTLEELEERAARKEIELKQLTPVSEAALNAASVAIGDEAADLAALSLDERERLLHGTSDQIAAAELEWKESNVKYQGRFREYEQLLKTNPKMELDAELKRLQEACAKSPLDVNPKFIVPDAFSDRWLAEAQTNVALWKQAVETVVKQAAELAAKVKRPEGEAVTQGKLGQLDKQVEEARKAHELLEKTITYTLGGIDKQGDLYGRLVEAEETHAKAQAEENRVSANAFAAKELYQAFEEAREKLQKDVVAPLESLVTTHFTALTGGLYERVAFSGSLTLSGVSTNAISDISLDDISFGTREQLVLLTRLSLAELLSRDGERQVVILDDNLVHTDSARMEFACKLLHATAKNMQIVVFTCHPERYAGIEGCRQLAMV